MQYLFAPGRRNSPLFCSGWLPIAGTDFIDLSQAHSTLRSSRCSTNPRSDAKLAQGFRWFCGCARQTREIKD